MKNNEIFGYTPDIKDKKFLGAYNRHRDSYSVFDLSPEIILMSARLSQILIDLDYADEDISRLKWEEIIKYVEIKRKLIDTATKLAYLKFRQEETQKMNELKMMQYDSISIKGLKEFLELFVSKLAKHVTPEKILEVQEEIAKILPLLE